MCLPYIYIVRYCSPLCYDSKLPDDIGDPYSFECKGCKLTRVSLIEGEKFDK